MNGSLQITRVSPLAGIPGGEVAIEYTGATAGFRPELNVLFDGRAAHSTAIGRKRALVLIPDIDKEGRVQAEISSPGESAAATADIIVGRQLATGLHPVANPTFDPNDASIYVTRSGSRGEHVPVSIFRITAEGNVEDFSRDVMNPTSIAFGRTGRMFVKSRFDGVVYRITPEHDVVAFAGDLGVATGLAFNRNGDMFVGDRGGNIFRINEIGEVKPWAKHEPSVSAYHLAFGPDEFLYVSGPTVSSFDAITRFDQEGRASTFYQGLGRPQGIAFDRAGNLYVAASLRGRRGIVRISADGTSAELVVAGMNLVGLAFGPKGEMVVATNESAYRLPLGIHGSLVQ